MTRIKNHLNKRELILTGIVVLGVILLLLNLFITSYDNNKQRTEIVFRNDASLRSKSLSNSLWDMEALLSVFMSNIETMRISDIVDRDLVIQMQKDLIKKDNNIYGISLVYEQNSYDSSNEFFTPYVWKNGETYEVDSFFEVNGYDVYENIKKSKKFIVQIELLNSSVPVLSLYLPIYDINGYFIGMGGISYGLSFLTDHLNEHISGDIICLLITDTDSNIVASFPKIEYITDPDLIYITNNIEKISMSSMDEMQYIKTRHSNKSDLMVISNAILLGGNHGLPLAESPFTLVHISKKTTLIGFLFSPGFSNINIFIAIITVISFVLLLSSFLLRKRKDALTGAYARDIVENELPKLIKAAVTAQKDACVILTDIDFFKKVNDTYGHIAGDKVLSNFTKIIKRCIRNEDWVARYGGEEFLIFLSNSNQEAGEQVAERIRQEMEKSFIDIESEIIRATASFGVSSLIHENINTSQQLIELADKRLYLAKESGRNKVC